MCADVAVALAVQGTELGLGALALEGLLEGGGLEKSGGLMVVEVLGERNGGQRQNARRGTGALVLLHGLEGLLFRELILVLGRREELGDAGGFGQRRPPLSGPVRVRHIGGRGGGKGVGNPSGHV